MWKENTVQQTASSPGFPPYCIMVLMALWHRCTAPMTPHAPRLTALNWCLETRQVQQTSQKEDHLLHHHLLIR